MSKILIIIPYRNREDHLKIFINEGFSVIKQCIANVKLLIVEQANDKPFNRGKILNVGLKENIDKYDSFILHDVDLIPSIDTINNIYTGEEFDVLRIFAAHNLSCGGICKIKSNVIKNINGFPNYIWGWGIEDRALYYRCKILNFNISPLFNLKCDLKKLPHKSNGHKYTGEKEKISNDEDHVFRFASTHEKNEHIQKSGLNDLKYEIVERINMTNDIELIKVDI
jgi:hypothetical protein